MSETIFKLSLSTSSRNTSIPNAGLILTETALSLRMRTVALNPCCSSPLVNSASSFIPNHSNSNLFLSKCRVKKDCVLSFKGSCISTTSLLLQAKRNGIKRMTVYLLNEFLLINFFLQFGVCWIQLNCLIPTFQSF